jgi:hypothetical protein
MKWGILIIQRSDGELTGFAGKWVSAYDPTYHQPSGAYDGGILEASSIPDRALTFSSPGDAMDKWKQPAGCRCHGTRWDGKPNRPLTAFTVSVEPLPLSEEI